MLAGGWWAGGRSGIHYGWGGGSTKHVLGEGGVEDIMDWVGVISTYI